MESVVPSLAWRILNGVLELVAFFGGREGFGGSVIGEGPLEVRMGGVGFGEFVLKSGVGVDDGLAHVVSLGLDSREVFFEAVSGEGAVVVFEAAGVAKRVEGAPVHVLMYV